MAVFIELTTDSFAENFRRQLGGGQGDGGNSNRSRRAGKSSARRPLRGIEIKEDTYALIKVIRADGREIPLFDSSSSDGLSSGGYTNFILQTVQEARMEKHQIVETFGDNYIFFFGENPRFLDIQAIVLNTHDFNWRAEWWANYDAYMRGSKLAELGARLYLFYDDIILEGYMVHSQAQEAADMPYHVSLQFKLFVTNYQNISFVGDPNFPIRSSVMLPDGIELTRGDAGGRLAVYYRGESFDQAQQENADRLFQDYEDSGGTAGVDHVETSKTVGPFEAAAFAESGPGFSSAGASFGPKQTESANPFVSDRRISRIIQSVPVSFAVSQNFWDFLFSRASDSEFSELRQLIVRAGNPIRGLISDNVDEFVGPPGPPGGFLDTLGGAGDHPPTSIQGTVLQDFEVEDLFREAIQFLSCYGADINNPNALTGLGLNVSFGLSGAGFGASASASVPGASAAAGASFGPDGFNSGFSTTVSDSFDSFSKDPLGAIFGHHKSKSNQLNSDRAKYTEGAGDPLYGYPSDFANGPGFGQAGFGDLGGLGFGSALGEHGDPGFKDPNKFTFAGVVDNRDAFERFMLPKNDPTAITLGGGLSLGLDGINGGAGVAVDGVPSAFALISVPGILDSTGTARQQAAAIALKQSQQKFGFSVDNPFGVQCPDQSGDLGFAEGFSYSLP